MNVVLKSIYIQYATLTSPAPFVNRLLQEKEKKEETMTSKKDGKKSKKEFESRAEK